MRAFAAPTGYLRLRDARDELRRQMYAGMPPSDTVEELRREGYDVGDHAQTMASARALADAIRSGDLDLNADLSSRENPRRISPELCQAAAQPSDGGVLTFAYIDRHPMAPFGLTRSDVRELTRDPLFVEEKKFGTWLRRQECKRVWPCHRVASAAPRRSPGRPRIQDDVIEVLKGLDANGTVHSAMPVKQVHHLVQEARPSLTSVSAETVRRAMREIGL